MRILTCTLTGITPYSPSKVLDPDVLPKGEKESAGDYDTRLWREKCSYAEDGETVVLPAMALKMAVDEAVKRLSIGVAGRGKTTYTKFFLAGQLCEADVPIGITRDKLKPISIWANADGLRGSRTRVKRLFPYIPAWGGEARFALLDDMIPTAVYERALVEAGRLIGVGRFRPEKGGMLGRFAVSDLRWQTV